MFRIVITAGQLKIAAELNDSPTAQAVWEVLPIQAEANIWGDEIYFEIPVKMAQAPEARAEVEIGTLGYWPVGNAFCIFFGPTPASTDGNPRAYSPVNIIGKVMGDATSLRSVAQGAAVRVAKAKV